MVKDLYTHIGYSFMAAYNSLAYLSLRDRPPIPGASPLLFRNRLSVF